MKNTAVGQTTESKIMAVLRVSSGNFIEMYDFMIFGYYASAIAKAFFPTGNEFTSLMASFMTFGAGFLMRPLGAIVLGVYIDKKGRRKGLLLTLALMSIGTFSTACTPSYATIGILAPILILAGRLLQGFSAGVELGGVSVYLSEIATPGKKGFYVSWQSASQQVAVIFAASLGMILNLLLPADRLSSWGWRIPLFVGCLIVPFLFWIRNSLTETEEFLARKSHPSVKELLKLISQNWRMVLAGTFLITFSTVSFYLITAYTPTFGASVLHLGAKESLIVALAVGLSNLFWLPISGTLSDRIGRRPILTVLTILSLLTAYPALCWLTGSPSFLKLLAVELWFSFIYAGYNGAVIVYLTELMPAAMRTAGFSLAYSFAAAFFGGFTPAMSTYLIHQTGNSAAPAFWLGFAALSAIFAIYFSGKEFLRVHQNSPLASSSVH